MTSNGHLMYADYLSFDNSLDDKLGFFLRSLEVKLPRD